MAGKTIILMLVVFLSGCAPALKPGADRDKHGCIGSAGYTWCAEREKCIRVWEEPCVSGEVIKACYECGGDLGSVNADFYQQGFASVRTQSGTYLLKQGVSGSGARYEGNGIELWDKGGKARLTINGTEYTCTAGKCR